MHDIYTYAAGYSGCSVPPVKNPGGRAGLISRKYANDYRLENYVSDNGKIVTRAVYRGDYFRFCVGAGMLRRTRALMTLALMSYWGVFWLGLFIDTSAMRQWYVSFPYFIGFLPSAFMTGSLYYFWKYTLCPPECGFTREERDRLGEKLTVYSFTQLLAAALALAGLIVFFIAGAPGAKGLWEILLAGCQVIMTAASTILIMSKKHTIMQVAS